MRKVPTLNNNYKQMSRIGKVPVAIPEKVDVTIKEQNVSIKWPVGTIEYTFTDRVSIKQVENDIVVTPVSEEDSALWGTTRAVLANMVEWATNGFKKSLEINGVWYKFEISGQKMILSIGFSHKVEMDVPVWLKAELDEKLKNVVHISGIDKQLVWEFAAKVKAKKKPEPYKGKGIKYVWEYVRRKAWKTGSK